MNRGSLKRRLSPRKECDKRTESDDNNGDHKDSDNEKRFRRLFKVVLTDKEVHEEKILPAEDVEKGASNRQHLTILDKSESRKTADSSNTSIPIRESNSSTTKSAVQNLSNLMGDNGFLNLSTNELSKNSDLTLCNRLGSNMSESSNVSAELEKELIVTDSAVDGYCQFCQKDISHYSAQRTSQHINRCIDELENIQHEKKRCEETRKILASKILDCPICGKKLKTSNARHTHLKKCATTFSVSPVALLEIVKKQEQEHQLLLQISDNYSLNENGEAPMRKMKPAQVKNKKRTTGRRLEEPQTKLDEDTQLAIALSTSIEDRRNSLVDFTHCHLPHEKKPDALRLNDVPLLPCATDLPSCRDAFSLLMSQKAKQLALPTKCVKKTKITKQTTPLLALDQSEMKRRLAEKAAALVIEKQEPSLYYHEMFISLPSVPESKLSSKYCYRKSGVLKSVSSQGFFWFMASQKLNSQAYYVEELVPPVVITECSPHEQQTSDEKPQQLNQMTTSVLYGSTQTAIVLAELAAEADAADSSFAYGLSQKNVASAAAKENLNLEKQQLEDAADRVVAKGFCSDNDMASDKAAVDLLRAWGDMVDNPCMSDLTLECRDGQVVHLHKLVLSTRCQNQFLSMDMETLKDVVCKFSKAAVLSVIRFIYCADIDIQHSVVFEAMRFAQRLDLIDFCQVCLNIIKSYDLIEAESCASGSVVAAAAGSYVDASRVDDEFSLLPKSDAVCLAEEVEMTGDGDLDEVYTFALTQRKNEMNGQGNSYDEELGNSILEKNSIVLEDEVNQTLRGNDSTSEMIFNSFSHADDYDDVFRQSDSCSDQFSITHDSRNSVQMTRSVEMDAVKCQPEAEEEASDSNVEMRYVSSEDPETPAAKEMQCLSSFADSVVIDSDTESANGTVGLISEKETFLCDPNDSIVNEESAGKKGSLSSSTVDLLHAGQEQEQVTSVNYTSIKPLTSSSKEASPKPRDSGGDVIAKDATAVYSSGLLSDGCCSPDLFPSSPCQENASLLSSCGVNVELEEIHSEKKSTENSLQKESFDVIRKENWLKTTPSKHEGNIVASKDSFLVLSEHSTNTLHFEKHSLLRAFRSQSNICSSSCQKNNLAERRCVSQTDEISDEDLLPDLDIENNELKIANKMVCMQEMDIGHCSASGKSSGDCNEVLLSQRNSSLDPNDAAILLDAEGDEIGDDDDDDGADNVHCNSTQCQGAGENTSQQTNSNEDDIWESFPEEECIPHIFCQNDEILSKIATPKSVKTAVNASMNFSPPTDLETDVSALMEDLVNSSLLNSDVSFETNSGLQALDRNLSPVVSMVREMVNASVNGICSPVTPMPGFGTMNTPALKQRCHNYGVRRLPKKQMVKVLENIYYELHPGVQKQNVCKELVETKSKRNGKNVSKPRQILKHKSSMKRALQDNCNQETSKPEFKMAYSEITQGKNLGSAAAAAAAVAEKKDHERLMYSDSDSEEYLILKSPNHQKPDSEAEERDSSLDCVPEESFILVKKRKRTNGDAQSKLSDGAKKAIVLNFFSKNDAIYSKILNYEPLELDFLKKLLKDNKIKIASSLLVDFLDEQNILFTTRNSRVGWNNRQALTKGKGDCYQEN